MKKLVIVLAAFATVGLALSPGVWAGTVIISGSDFSNPTLVGAYNGTYVPGSPGYMHLSYTGDDDAVVGAKGPFGTLSSLNMSFTFSNPVGTGNAPYAAFGISDNSTWVADNHRLNVISMDGNELIGTSLVHVWDWNLNGGEGGDLPGLGQSDNVTLNSILSIYGTWEVMRAYAYIGNTGGPSSGSVDINSISVFSAVPEPSLILLLGMGLGAACLVGRRKRI